MNIHRIVDYQPFSVNKVRMVNRLTKDIGISGLDRLEFFFPIIRFHSRWDELEGWAVGAPENDFKASMHYIPYYEEAQDQRPVYTRSEALGALPDDVSDVMNELLDYIEDENINVLFMKSSQVGTAVDLERMNTLERIVTARGYPCLDLIDRFEEIGLDPEYDFYNNYHTNIHGSLKYSRFLADYLVEEYGFKDKRGLPGWESWDKSAVDYFKEAAPWLLPFELETGNRDFRLESPELQSLEAGDDSVTLSWTASAGAQGYEIYRIIKGREKTWSLLARVDSGTLTYTDEGLSAPTEYAYTVAPCRQTPEGTLYGNFNVIGISAETGE